MPELTFNHIAVLLIVLVAAVWDVRTAKIPNLLTFPAAALGIVSSGIASGWWGALMAVAGWVVGVAIMIILNPKGKNMAFGDVKLMAAIGTFVWWNGVLLTFLYFALIYGVIAVSRIGFSIPWGPLLTAMGTFGGDVEKALQSVDLEKMNKARKSGLPLSPAMFLGLLMAICLEDASLRFMGFR